MESPWIIYEIAASVASAETVSGKRVIPVALGKDVSPSGILAQYQWITTSGNADEVAERIVKALGAPYERDKVRERESALRNLNEAEQALELNRVIWSNKTYERNARFVSWLLAAGLVTLLLLGAGAILVIVWGQSTVVAAIFGALVPLITIPLAYLVGRYYRSGAPDDRSDK